METVSAEEASILLLDEGRYPPSPADWIPLHLASPCVLVHCASSRNPIFRLHPIINMT